MISEHESNAEQLEPAAAPAKPWTRPVLTRMAAADAEVGTRNTGPDGSFSVS